MKRIPILTLLLSALAISSYAATLSGTVTNSSSTTPVAGQKVYVMDSLGYWNDSTITNAAGGYSMTIPATLPSGNLLMAHTEGCGGTNAWWNGVYSGSNLTANFTTCTLMLQGTLSLGGTANTGQAMIYLIRENNDSVAVTTTLTAIDSFLSAPTGGTFSKAYTSIPGGKLLLKAALLPAHPAYASYMPTYYTSSASWNTATPISTPAFKGAASNITMLGGTNPGGPGFIGGDVVLGANKSSGAGDPLPKRILILANAANKPIAYTYSDAKGHFEFRNLPFGTYRIFGDAMGKSNPSLEVSLPTTTPVVNGIVFKETSTSFTGALSTLGIRKPAALASLNVYPNPVTTHVQIDGLAAIKGDKTITVRSMTGAVISSQTASAASLRIATSELPAGIYILQVATEAGNASFQLVK
jgi:hypothetical protein